MKKYTLSIIITLLMTTACTTATKDRPFPLPQTTPSSTHPMCHQFINVKEKNNFLGGSGFLAQVTPMPKHLHLHPFVIPMIDDGIDHRRTRLNLLYENYGENKEMIVVTTKPAAVHENVLVCTFVYTIPEAADPKKYDTLLRMSNQGKYSGFIVE